MVQTKQESFIGDDAAYILGPVARLLLESGVVVSRRDAKRALRATARRMLRIAASEARLPLSLAEKHVGSVMQLMVG
jgi:hypothetical protein